MALPLSLEHAMVFLLLQSGFHFAVSVVGLPHPDDGKVFSPELG
jgi:hypothetical protein